MMLSIFSCACLNPYIFFGENLFKSSDDFKKWLFVFLLLNFETYLYILDTSPLSNMHLENIFSHPVLYFFLFILWKQYIPSFKYLTSSVGSLSSVCGNLQASGSSASQNWGRSLVWIHSRARRGGTVMAGWWNMQSGLVHWVLKLQCFGW